MMKAVFALFLLAMSLNSSAAGATGSALLSIENEAYSLGIQMAKFVPCQKAVFCSNKKYKQSRMLQAQKKLNSLILELSQASSRPGTSYRRLRALAKQQQNHGYAYQIKNHSIQSDNELIARAGEYLKKLPKAIDRNRSAALKAI